jgi:hypothetical protein
MRALADLLADPPVRLRKGTPSKTSFSAESVASRSGSATAAAMRLPSK